MALPALLNSTSLRQNNILITTRAGNCKNNLLAFKSSVLFASCHWQANPGLEPTPKPTECGCILREVKGLSEIWDRDFPFDFLFRS